jgi:uncharacterized protein with GYD domain
VENVPQYICLGNLTRQGVGNLADAPKRDEDARRLVEQAGGKVQIYYTLGECDFVAIIEMPDDESMLKFLLQIGRMGNVVAKTLKAWSESEFANVVAQIRSTLK